MLHSRAFALNENQPFSIQARTPGPSGSHLSSIRKKAMTTGKRPTLGGENPGGFPVDAGAIGPKQLFKDFMGSKTPARGALGDRTNKTPGPSSVCFRNQEGGKGSDNSPLKAMKPSTGKVRKSLTRSPSKGSSLRQSPTKSSTLPANPDQSYMTDVSTAMTPVPSASTLKERILSRQNSFVTPAANIGRAGQMKAMMGEMKDAEMGFKVADGDGADLDHANGQVKEMTDEEMYPEIEYMPPSHYAYNIPYYFPEELENLPRAAEIGQMLASFRPLGFHGRDESSKEAEDRKVQTLDLPSDPELDPANLSSDDDSGVDELWPDVAIATNSIPATTPGQRVETTSLQRRSVSAVNPASLRSKSTPIRTVKPASLSRPGSSSSSTATASVTRPSTSASTKSGTSSRTTCSRQMADLAMRRSLTNATDRRSNVQTAKSVSKAASRSTLSYPSRVGATMMTSLSKSTVTASKTSQQRAHLPSRACSSPNTAAVKIEMNPALKDLANDRLGKFVQSKLKEQEFGFEGLALGSDSDEKEDDEEAESAETQGSEQASNQKIESER